MTAALTSRRLASSSREVPRGQGRVNEPPCVSRARKRSVNKAFTLLTLSPLSAREEALNGSRPPDRLVLGRADWSDARRVLAVRRQPGLKDDGRVGGGAVRGREEGSTSPSCFGRMSRLRRRKNSSLSAQTDPSFVLPIPPRLFRSHRIVPSSPSGGDDCLGARSSVVFSPGDSLKEASR
jgi:hypothetical protein